MGECNTILSAYTMYRHLEGYCTQPSNYYSCHFMVNIVRDDRNVVQFHVLEPLYKRSLF